MVDSVVIGTGIHTKTYAKLGIAEEICIENIKLSNVPFLISYDKIIKDTAAHLTNYEIKGIIGLPVLQTLNHFVITKSKLAIITKQKQKQKYPSNMIICQNKMLIQASIPNASLCLKFDSGAAKSYLSKKYLLSSKIEYQKLSMDSIRIGSYGGFKMIQRYKKENFHYIVGKKKIHFPTIDIYMDDMQTTSIPVDGVAGIDVILKNKQTILDFKHMSISFK